MIVAIVLAVGASLLFAPWRVSTGLLLGGLLSLFNHYWLITSTTAAFSVLVNGEKPRLSLTQYVLRYAVIGAGDSAVVQVRACFSPGANRGLVQFCVRTFCRSI